MTKFIQDIRPEIKKDIDKHGFCILQQDNLSYHSEKGFFSSTQLKNIMMKVPAKYKWEMDHPEDKKVFVIGGAYDDLIFDKARFDSTYACFENAMKPFPDDTFRKKENKLARDKFISNCESEKKIVLMEDDVDMFQGMYESLFKNEVVANIIHDCIPQICIYFFDKELGLYCKVKPDGVRKSMPVFVELKTTQDAFPLPELGFNKEVAKYRYHLQGELYRRGLIAANKYFSKPFVKYSAPINNGIWIAQEKEPPYLSSVIFMSDDDLKLGAFELNMAAERLKECLSSGVWKGYEMFADNDKNSFVSKLPSYYSERISKTVI